MGKKNQIQSAIDELESQKAQIQKSIDILKSVQTKAPKAKPRVVKTPEAREAS